MESDQDAPLALTEYEGTVPALFRRADCQLSVPQNLSQAYYLEVQLKVVRSEAAIRWRNQFAEADDQQGRWDEEGCGSRGSTDGVWDTKASGGGTRSLSAPENQRTSYASASSGYLEGDKAVHRGFNPVISDNSSDGSKRLLGLQPWINRYQKQNEVFLKGKRRLDVFHPLRRADGYESLLSLPSSTVMTSSENRSETSVEVHEKSSEDLPDFRDVDEQSGDQHDRIGRVGQLSVHQHLGNPAAGTEDLVCSPSHPSSAGTSDPNAEKSSLEYLFIGEQVHGYTFTKRLDDGASSVIFLVEKEDETFVGKVSIYPCSKTDKRFKILRHEYTVMKKLQHPQIVKVYEYFVHCDHGVIIMEYMEQGELWSHLDDNWPLPPKELQLILYDIARAVRHIHQKGFTHMDIKTNNILMDNRGRVKLADFGGAKRFGRLRKRHRFNFFTPEFSPPEKQEEEESGIRLISHYKYYDIWSFGVVCYQLYTGQLPYTLSEGQRFIHRDAFVEPVTFPEDSGTNMYLLLLVRECLRIEPSRRITPKEAVFHPYFYSPV